jgi:DNA-binding LytR/AlgR family response regulator
MKKILVIEDEQGIREGICDILNDSGFQAVGASDGKTGVELAKTVSPDLIVCDVMLPGLNGYEILTELKEHLYSRQIPFIFLTALSDRTYIRQGMELGADDFISKPFTEEELLNAINIRLEKLEKIKSSAEASAPETQDKQLGLDDRIFVTVDDKPVFLKIADIVRINSSGDYSNILTIDKSKLFVRKTMKEWEQILPEKYFARIHRTTIINLEAVEKIEKWFNQAYRVFLKSCTEPFIISRRYFKKLRGQF